MDMKSNKEVYNARKKDGTLNNQLGKPIKLLQKIIAKGYPLILVLMSIGLVTWTIKVKNKLNKGKVFVHVFVGAIFGWIWNLWILKIDPNYPSWMFHPFSTYGNRIFIKMA